MSALPWTLAAVVVVAVIGCTLLLRMVKDQLSVSNHSENLNGDISAQQAYLTHVSGLTYSEAEALLDWLEQHGYQERTLRCEAELFTVEFRIDAEHPPTQGLGMPHLLRVKATEKAQV
jgi:hypothetical protein